MDEMVTSGQILICREYSSRGIFSSTFFVFVTALLCNNENNCLWVRRGKISELNIHTTFSTWLGTFLNCFGGDFQVPDLRFPFSLFFQTGMSNYSLGFLKEFFLLRGDILSPPLSPPRLTAGMAEGLKIWFGKQLSGALALPAPFSDLPKSGGHAPPSSSSTIPLTEVMWFCCKLLASVSS